MTDNPQRLTIVGSGLIGLILSLALAKQRLPCTLIGDTRPAKDDNRVSAIAMATWEYLKSIGVTSGLETSPINHIRVADGHLLRGISSLVLDFPRQSEPFGYMVRNGGLLTQLSAQVRRSPYVQRIEGATVTAANAHTGELTLSNRQSWQADILLACDGRASFMREQAGIRVTRWAYRSKALTTIVSHPRSHNGTAVELFYPDGPFAILPAGRHESSVVWTTRHPEKFATLPPDQFLKQLQWRFGDWLGPLALTETSIASYDLRFLNAEIYGKERVFLVGDAAHTIHPIAGQGLNLGIRDIKALVALLSDLPWDAVPALARRYERERRVDATAMAVATDGLQRLFAIDRTPIAAARRLGIATLNRIPVVKERIARYAMGF